jgi:hypothetical protein
MIINNRHLYLLKSWAYEGRGLQDGKGKGGRYMIITFLNDGSIAQRDFYLVNLIQANRATAAILHAQQGLSTPGEFF